MVMMVMIGHASYAHVEGVGEDHAGAGGEEAAGHGLPHRQLLPVPLLLLPEQLVHRVLAPEHGRLVQAVAPHRGRCAVPHGQHALLGLGFGLGWDEIVNVCFDVSVI